jgi:hypothetical protein
MCSVAKSVAKNSATNVKNQHNNTAQKSQNIHTYSITKTLSKKFLILHKNSQLPAKKCNPQA